MLEHIKPAYGHQEVVITWKDEWYRIPFFVLEDIAEIWDRTKRNNLTSEKKEPHGDGRALDNWVKKWSGSWKQEAIPNLKKILECEMPAMIAYKMYDMEDSQ